jgi:hypothetical protein
MTGATIAAENLNRISGFNYFNSIFAGNHTPAALSFQAQTGGRDLSERERKNIWPCESDGFQNGGFLTAL